MTIITRQQYMANSSELHRAYYAQFITSAVRANVSRMDLATLQHDFKIEDERGDVTQKLYPLRVWDNFLGAGNGTLMVECGDYMTKAGSVCIHKEAARQRVEKAIAEGKL